MKEVWNARTAEVLSNSIQELVCVVLNAVAENDARPGTCDVELAVSRYIIRLEDGEDLREIAASIIRSAQG